MQGILYIIATTCFKNEFLNGHRTFVTERRRAIVKGQKSKRTSIQMTVSNIKIFLMLLDGNRRLPLGFRLNEYRDSFYFKV